MTPCLTDAQLQAVLDGRVAGDSPEWAHLRDCRACRTVVALAQSSSRTTLSVDGDGVAPPPAELPRGHTIGRYLVLAQLGAGGMGVVYAAYDSELDRRIAVKVLKPTGDPDELLPRRARMLAEAKSMARLTHPNVIRVYDVGEHEDSLFIAMELVDGTTLGGWVHDQKRTWKEVVAKFAAAGAGLAAAHEAGIVHRDFKPANVLVSVDGQVFVTDFGLARAFAPRAEPVGDVRAMATPPPFSASAITLRGVIVGTPSYMAPEVLLGEPATTRSDIFSFGVALYEALYGTLPFERRTIGQVREALLRGPSELRDAVALPRWLRHELARALSADPAARHASMRELVDALAKDRTRKWKRAGAAAAAALVAAGVVLSAASRGGPDAVELCRSAGGEARALWNDEVRAEVEASFLATKRPAAAAAVALVSRGLDDWSERYVAQTREVCVATRQRTMVPALLARRTACLDRRRLETAALLDLYRRADQRLVERAANAIERLEDIAACADLAALSAPVPPPTAAQQPGVDQARGEIARAVALGSAGKESQGLEVATAALATATAAGHVPTTAEARLELGRLLQLLGRFDDALDPFQRAEWEALSVHDDLLAARASLGIVQVRGTQQGRFDEARHELELTKALILRIGGDARLEVNLHNTLGQMAYREGKFADAAAHYREALALRKRADAQRRDGGRSFGATDNAIRNNLANALSAMGRYAEALAEHHEVLRARLAAEGPMHPNVANTYNNMGQAYADQFAYREALAVYEQSLASRKLLLPADHWLIGMSEANIGIVLAALGEDERALELLSHGLELMEKKIGGDHPDVATLLSEIAGVQLALGAIGDAEASLERAFAVLDASVGRDHAQAARTLEVQGAWLLATGDPDGAVAAYRQAVAIHDVARPGTLASLPALAGLGAAELAAAEPEAAIATLEQAFALGAAGDAAIDGDVAFALARAESLMADDAAADTFLTVAKARYQQADGSGGAKRLHALTRWSDERPR